jgi:hypothetical protein
MWHLEQGKMTSVFFGQFIAQKQYKDRFPIHTKANFKDRFPIQNG